MLPLLGLLNSPLSKESVNLSGMCKTFRGTIRLWKLNNVVFWQQAVINIETQISLSKNLSKTSILAKVLCDQSWEKGWICLEGKLQIMQVEVFVCWQDTVVFVQPTNPMTASTDTRKSVKNIFFLKNSNFFFTSVPIVSRHALQTCKEQLKTQRGDRRWQA